MYHTRCLDITADLPKDWVCPECEVEDICRDMLLHVYTFMNF